MNSSNVAVAVVEVRKRYSFMLRIASTSSLKWMRIEWIEIDTQTCNQYF